MKLLLLLITSTFALATAAQCDPDKKFYPSSSIEIASDWGGIVQIGFSGQISRLSAHIGMRFRTIVDSVSTSKGTEPESKLFPRLELGYRIINGLHINAGLSEDPDISVTAYKRTGDRTAIYGRGLYDGTLVFALGLKVLFYRE